ncbi:MAG TPA: asparagine synthetase B, partial [Flammeovirgaceae bacterium]|nr:asparagine synthetase B [Flammeovirgaceae bacterium]
MCGIAGFIDYPATVAPYIHEVAGIQRHRGPDHQALWQKEGVALCHQRLSIIDLSAAANQPMMRDRLVIVYNGELYNYRELRARLEKEQNVTFTTESDTEVILAAYR